MDSEGRLYIYIYVPIYYISEESICLRGDERMWEKLGEERGEMEIMSIQCRYEILNYLLKHFLFWLGGSFLKATKTSVIVELFFC